MTESTKAFVLQHVHQFETHDDIKLLGVNSTKELADEAVVRFSRLEGFRDHLEGFHIDGTMLDFDYWDEGFFTV